MQALSRVQFEGIADTLGMRSPAEEKRGLPASAPLQQYPEQVQRKMSVGHSTRTALHAIQTASVTPSAPIAAVAVQGGVAFADNTPAEAVDTTARLTPLELAADDSYAYDSDSYAYSSSSSSSNSSGGGGSGSSRRVSGDAGGGSGSGNTSGRPADAAEPQKFDDDDDDDYDDDDFD